VAPASSISSWLWVYQHGFARGHSTELTSLAFALAFTAICFVPNWILWRKKIFLKV
jgi:predicted acyltransferase